MRIQNEAPGIKDLNDFLKKCYDREQRRKFDILKTGRVDVFREVVTSDSLPIHLVQQPFSEIPMENQSDRAKTGKSLPPMSKRIELVKRTKDENVNVTDDKTSSEVSSPEDEDKTERPPKRVKERFFVKKKDSSMTAQDSSDSLVKSLGAGVKREKLVAPPPGATGATSKAIVRDAPADDIDIYLITDSDSEEDNEEETKEKISMQSSESVKFVKEEIGDTDETEVLKEIFGIEGEDELSAIVNFTQQSVSAAEQQCEDRPSTSRSLKDPDSPPTGTVVSLNQTNLPITSLGVENGRLANVVTKHEETISSLNQRLSKYKEALAKVDRKVAKKRSDLVRADAKIEELTKENQKLTKRYHKSVDEKGEKEKTLERTKADCAVKQLKITKLEETLRRKQELEESKIGGRSTEWKSLLVEEKQNQIEELESLLKGKEESISAKMETIMTLEVESKSKEIQYIQLSSKLENVLANLAAERNSNEELRAKNEKLERYMLQKSHTMNQEVAERIQHLEAQLGHFKEENLRLSQNSNVSMIQILQEKENAIQREKAKFDQLLKEEMEASAQKVANMELQNFDLMSQIQYVPMLQNKVKELEARLVTGTTVAPNSAPVEEPDPVLLNANNMTMTTSWVNSLTHQGLLSSILEAQAGTNPERPGTPESSAKLDSLVNETEKPISERLEAESKSHSLASKNPTICLQKFSSLCSESFNVNQSQWSDGSENESEALTDGLLSLHKTKTSNLDNPDDMSPKYDPTISYQSTPSPLHGEKPKIKSESQTPKSEDASSNPSTPSPPLAPRTPDLESNVTKIKQEMDIDEEKGPKQIVTAENMNNRLEREDLKETFDNEYITNQFGDDDNIDKDVKGVRSPSVPPLKEDMSDDKTQEKCESGGDDQHRKNICEIRELVKRVEKRKKKLEECFESRRKKDKKHKETKKKKRKKEKRKSSSTDNCASPDLSFNDHLENSTFSETGPKDDSTAPEDVDSSDVVLEEERRVLMRGGRSPTEAQVKIKEEMDFRTRRQHKHKGDEQRQRAAFDDEEAANLKKDLHNSSSSSGSSSSSSSGRWATRLWLIFDRAFSAFTRTD